MEFRFRAGEGRAPSIIPRPGLSIQDPGLFAPQSLHGGLGAVYGGEIEREMDMRLHPHRALGALRRELIKGQIREDIIAREMSERRILEEEVLREMEMERALGIRRAPLVEQLVLGPPMPMPEVMMAERLLPGPSMRHLEVRVQEDLPPLQFNPNVRFRNAPAFVHDGGEVESGRKEPDFVDAGDNLEEEEEEQSPVSKVPGSKVPVSKVKQIHPKVSGIKRKGAAVIGSKKVARGGQQNLTCALCLVSVTSEDGFNDHLKGKKHQAKVTRLTLEDNGTSNGSAAPSTPNKAGAMSPQYVLEPGMKRMTMMVDGKSHQVVKKKSFLWCEPCAVRCNSTAMMVSHLGGRKHLVQVGEINSQGKPVKEGVSGEEVNESGAESEAME